MVDRKALIREYKERPRQIGIYRVHNLHDDRSLVGSSRDLPSILNRHRAQLRIGAHHNRALQRDWNALGADAFAFEVLDTLEPREEPNWDPGDDLAVLERLWLERLEPYDDRGYNARPKAKG